MDRRRDRRPGTAQAGGDASEATRVLRRDWRAIQRTQATLVQLDDATKEAA